MEVNVNGKTMRSLAGDAVKSAEAVHLVHVTDKITGITREWNQKGFEYFYKSKRIKKANDLKRIKSLVIPPAWENVWICPFEDGHLQATGYDTKKRKQYRYHPLWIALRGKTKFYRLREFGDVLPTIRQRLQKDLRLKGLSREKVLATVISLMEQTNIRIGNALYEKLYGSFGLSTFHDKNVKVNGSSIRFVFKGKKGVSHDINIRNKKLARIVHRCREIPGKDLFQYYDEKNHVQSINSGDVNDYIRQISGKDFTSKDFRTWAGSVECIRAFKGIGFEGTDPMLKKNMVKAIDRVAVCLGNTRSVCKKYYVHPITLKCYENGQLEKYVKKFRRGTRWMEPEERILMKMLESHTNK
ncbi:MAG TPA: DNA topoisomerase IB [Chitinophagaceae bacterium]|nr:DNA topoisomerase IB [Chitinophagaceae bacterium]